MATSTVIVPISYVMVGVFSSLHSFMFWVLCNPAFSPSGLYATLVLYHRVLCNPLLLYLGLCTLPSSCACTMQLRNPATLFLWDYAPATPLCGTARYSFVWDYLPAIPFKFVWDHAPATPLYGTMHLLLLYMGLCTCHHCTQALCSHVMLFFFGYYATRHLFKFFIYVSCILAIYRLGIMWPIPFRVDIILQVSTHTPWLDFWFFISASFRY